MIKRLLALSALLLLTSATVAQAQDYPPADNTIVTDKTIVVAGTPITITAKTYQVGATVTFTLFSAPVTLGTATANAQGVATLTVTIPANTENGVHHIDSTGTGSTGTALQQSTAITVTGGTTATTTTTVAGATTTTVAGVTTTTVAGVTTTTVRQGAGVGTVPKTGTSSTMPMTEAGVGAIAVGGLLVLVARRRRTAGSAR